MVTHHIPITTQSWIDKVFVLLDGQIVEAGSSKQLLEKGGLYCEWIRASELEVNRGTGLVEQNE